MNTKTLTRADIEIELQKIDIQLDAAPLTDIEVRSLAKYAIHLRKLLESKNP